jgi:hypothetical protein
MTMPYPIQPKQPRRELKNYSGNILNIHLSLDLAPGDFHLYGLLKNHFGRYFADNEKVEMEMWKWLRQQSKDLCAAGFSALLKHWDICINVDGGYVKKLTFFPGLNITSSTLYIHL